MDPSDAVTLVGKQVVGAGVGYIIAQIRAMTPSTRMEAARREMLDDLVTDTTAALAKLAERVVKLEASGPEAEKLLGAALHRLVPETLSSLTRERRRLMAAALAGIVSPDLTLEQKSRVTRAISLLEPSDVIHLRLFEEHNRSPYSKEPRTADATRDNWIKGGRGMKYEVASLEAAGCLALIPGPIKSGHLLTPLGKDVLAYIQDWEPDAAAATDTSAAEQVQPKSGSST